ncbi:MAG: serine acetyltransferase [Lachnospiraceae bacterium]|nr:serine acetyltransferase [Lachnospiraceae bacterium]
MIQSKQDYLFYLEADKIALGEKRTRPHIISIWEADIIWKFQRLLRKVEYLHNCKSSGLNYLYYKWEQYHLFKLQVKYGLNIPINFFGPGMSIAHLGPCVINGFARIGKNCRIHPFTTIGIDGRSSKVASIGDNVYLSNGCKIIGNVNICDNVVIGAGAVVVKDIVEENTVCGGIPAKVISHSGNSFPLERRGADILMSNK